MKKKGKLVLVRADVLRPSAPVIILSDIISHSSVIFSQLVEQLDEYNWSISDGSVWNSSKMFRYAILLKENATTCFFTVKHKQWQACFAGKSELGNEVEFEIIEQDDVTYAKIIPKTFHYNEEDIMRAYDLGRNHSNQNIKASKDMVLNDLKNRI